MARRVNLGAGEVVLTKGDRGPVAPQRVIYHLELSFGDQKYQRTYCKIGTVITCSFTWQTCNLLGESLLDSFQSLFKL